MVCGYRSEKPTMKTIDDVLEKSDISKKPDQDMSDSKSELSNKS